MSDIVERLRNPMWSYSDIEDRSLGMALDMAVIRVDMDEAADEIERLRAECELWKERAHAPRETA